MSADLKYITVEADSAKRHLEEVASLRRQLDESREHAEEWRRRAEEAERVIEALEEFEKSDDFMNRAHTASLIRERLKEYRSARAALSADTPGMPAVESGQEGKGE